MEPIPSPLMESTFPSHRQWSWLICQLQQEWHTSGFESIEQGRLGTGCPMYTHPRTQACSWIYTLRESNFQLGTLDPLFPFPAFFSPPMAIPLALPLYPHPHTKVHSFTLFRKVTVLTFQGVLTPATAHRPARMYARKQKMRNRQKMMSCGIHFVVVQCCNYSCAILLICEKMINFK